MLMTFFMKIKKNLKAEIKAKAIIPFGMLMAERRD